MTKNVIEVGKMSATEFNDIIDREIKDTLATLAYMESHDCKLLYDDICNHFEKAFGMVCIGYYLFNDWEMVDKAYNRVMETRSKRASGYPFSLFEYEC